MAKHDMRAVGITAGVQRHRVAASATRGYSGDPLMITPTYTSGVTGTNTVTVMTDAKPTVATDEFKGICSQDFIVNSAGTVLAHYTESIMFIPYATKVRGKAETPASVNTQSELTGLLGDLVAFTLDTGVYTIQTGGEADSAGLQIIDGDIARGTLDCVVDARTMRKQVA